MLGISLCRYRYTSFLNYKATRLLFVLEEDVVDAVAVPFIRVVEFVVVLLFLVPLFSLVAGGANEAGTTSLL